MLAHVLDEGIHVKTPGIPVELIDHGRAFEVNSVSITAIRSIDISAKLARVRGLASLRVIVIVRIDASLNTLDHIGMDIPACASGRGKYLLTSVFVPLS